MGALNILLVDDDRNLVTTLSYGLRKAMGNGISVAYVVGGSLQTSSRSINGGYHGYSK